MMDDLKTSVENLFIVWKGFKPEAIIPLIQSGGSRKYFRVLSNNESFIATYGNNKDENEYFLSLSKHFHKKGHPVPAIYFVSNDKTIYFQQDLGNQSLLEVLQSEGETEHTFELYKKSLAALASLQIQGAKGLDLNNLNKGRPFGRQAILDDLLYFKYYFLDVSGITYDKYALSDEFERFATLSSKQSFPYFMYRDFQGRNIMVQDDKIGFIDFQGGMLGPIQYDMASLLWQAKANLSKEWKRDLFKYYLDKVEEYLGEIDKVQFEAEYKRFVWTRQLQVLGAYGLRGLFEKKRHFLESIAPALRTIGNHLKEDDSLVAFPTLSNVLGQISSEEMIKNFELPKIENTTTLSIKIYSFSYIKNGIPKDDTENGGGFVFDMRGIYNPGRLDEYKCLNGLDESVKTFLETQTKMPSLLDSVHNVVDITIENYIQRGFENLMISFGCTGGQHRSVYAAESTKLHLEKKYGIKVLLVHLNKENWRVV